MTGPARGFVFRIFYIGLNETLFPTERLTMFEKKRIKLELYVDLDPIPGAFHTKEDAAKRAEAILRSSINHYSPVILIPQQK